MDREEMLSNWLKEHGYDGLYNVSEGCGCDYNDLAPCGCPAPIEACRPGYRVDCTPDCDHGWGGYEPGDWHIQAEKPEGV